MTFLGMGYVEIFVVLLIAFVFLGPEKMVDSAKKLTKVVKEIRKMASELPSVADLDLDTNLDDTRSVGKPSGGDGVAGRPGSEVEEDKEPSVEEGPVAFKPEGKATDTGYGDEEGSQDKA